MSDYEWVFFPAAVLAVLLFRIALAPFWMQREVKQNNVALREILEKEEQGVQPNITLLRAFTESIKGRNTESGDELAEVASLELMNDPETPSPDADIGLVRSAIDFYDQAGIFLVRATGVWCNSELVMGVFSSPQRHTGSLKMNEKVILELAIRLPNGNIYAKDASTMRPESQGQMNAYRLSSLPVRVKVKLDFARLTREFHLRLDVVDNTLKITEQ
ncbi:MAG: hypothetical protein QF357_05550 [Dehalococcoidia bacterium]|nr:hypothetical protein [Dehalococcoidia bacterium]